MVWVLSRDDEEIHVQTWYDRQSSELVVVTKYPDRHRTSERFADFSEFWKWLALLSQELEPDGWRLRGPLFSVPGGPSN
jgi:hypothetical protein